MHTNQLLTVAVVAVVALSVVGPAAAADGLDVSVTQEGDDVTVSVTDNSTENRTAVAGANVTVADGNTTYEETGNYTTDDEGLVELSAPEENITVTVTATADNASASTTTDLIAESSAENETDERDTNESDDDEPANETGDRDINETDDREADRLFDLDLDVSIDDGDVDHSNVTVNDSEPFGLYVGAFVQTVMSENVSGPMGQTVSSFVTEFNPGQGPPEHAGPPTNGTERGPPEHAGPPTNETERGPPEDAGPSTNETERGPPEDVGPTDNETERGPPEDVGPSTNETERGPPEDVGPTDNETERGPPEDVGPTDNETERGPPEDVGPTDTDSDRNETDTDDRLDNERDGESSETDTDDEPRRGPPSHARGGW